MRRVRELHVPSVGTRKCEVWREAGAIHSQGNADTSDSRVRVRLDLRVRDKRRVKPVNRSVKPLL